jgi:hypothetical protein
MIENAIALDLARFDRKAAQGLCLASVINHDILFGPDQKRDAFLKKVPQEGYPRIAAIHDEKRPNLHGKAAHDGHNQGMFQNVLALLDRPIREARKSHGKDSSLKDQAHEQGGNPSDGRLIQNHGPSLSHGLKTTDQGDMERN